jgi:hypothetical protein
MAWLDLRVIPVRAELVWDTEVVQEAPACWDWALGDPRRSVHPIGAILEHAMPVHGGGIGHVVGNIYQQSIAAVHANQRAGKPVIDQEHGPIDACPGQRTNVRPHESHHARAYRLEHPNLRSR